MDDMSDFLFQDTDKSISQNVVDTLIEAANMCTQDLSTPDLSLTGRVVIVYLSRMSSLSPLF